MIKTPSGTTIYEFDENGEVLDTYRYDSEGRPMDTVESKDRFGNTVIKPKIYEGVVAIREPSGELQDKPFDMYYDSLMKAGIPEDVYRGAVESTPGFEPFDFDDFKEADSELFKKGSKTSQKAQDQSRSHRSQEDSDRGL